MDRVMQATLTNHDSYQIYVRACAEHDNYLHTEFQSDTGLATSIL